MCTVAFALCGLRATWLLEDVDFAIVLRKAASSLTRAL